MLSVRLGSGDHGVFALSPLGNVRTCKIVAFRVYFGGTDVSVRARRPACSVGLPASRSHLLDCPMRRVKCFASLADEGPHIEFLNSRGFEFVLSDLKLNTKNEDVLISELQGFCAVLAGSEPYTPRVLRAAPQLRVIARTGVGYDAVDVPTCDELGIVVATTPGVNHHAVAEHTIAMLMGVARGFPEQDQSVRAGVWTREKRPRVMGSTLGIVGLGRIGQALVPRALGLGLKLLVCEPYPDKAFVAQHGIELTSFEDLLARSDYVTLHSPLGAETRHMMNAKTFAKMKPGAVLINTSRGGLVDENALCAALESGKLRGAGLDVFETEPLPVTSPLLKFRNVLLAGHVAGLDADSQRDTLLMSADTIVKLHAGEWPAERIRNLPNVKNWTWERR